MKLSKPIILYCAFVLIKALWGYHLYGALALRHAALFYYPLYALVAFKHFKKKHICLIFPLIFALAIFSFFTLHSRTAIIANYISMIFLICAVRFKRSATITLLIVSSIFFYATHDKPSMHTIVNVNNTVFKFAKHYYNSKYQPRSISVQKELERIEEPSKRKTKIYVPQDETEHGKIESNPIHANDEKAEVLIKEYKKTRGENDNHIFRMLIWRDMLAEMWQKKAILGFHFGKPFNSKSLVALTWADSEWKRDGWIAAHNSYLEIIYRAGILGVYLVYLLLGATVIIIKQGKSFITAFLCAVLLNYLIAANFLLILELPYTAIPFWCLFGVTVRMVKA